jgi:hypothetical protein
MVARDRIQSAQQLKEQWKGKILCKLVGRTLLKYPLRMP